MVPNDIRLRAMDRVSAGILIAAGYEPISQ